MCKVFPRSDRRGAPLDRSRCVRVRLSSSGNRMGSGRGWTPPIARPLPRGHRGPPAALGPVTARLLGADGSAVPLGAGRTSPPRAAGPARASWTREAGGPCGTGTGAPRRAGLAERRRGPAWGPQTRAASSPPRRPRPSPLTGRPQACTQVGDPPWPRLRPRDAQPRPCGPGLTAGLPRAVSRSCAVAAVAPRGCWSGSRRRIMCGPRLVATLGGYPPVAVHHDDDAPGREAPTVWFPWEPREVPRPGRARRPGAGAWGGVGPRWRVRAHRGARGVRGVPSVCPRLSAATAGGARVVPSCGFLLAVREGRAGQLSGDARRGRTSRAVPGQERPQPPAGEEAPQRPASGTAAHVCMAPSLAPGRTNTASFPPRAWRMRGQAPALQPDLSPQL